ncbi:Hypothetical protein, putative [Bodo saltans]|uniref:Uncharacterized protein n=1 Tax=Bodo saltans TaxID=75058 RepID=A0A0S4J4Y1_BODSA|nr:Hypothetical protein, putative [Bodo saltans]|eukprot:CUG86277.1 Hypothetical protein, putative [Bodo saltans]
MFNSAAYSAGSNRRTPLNSRWVTAEPVTYGLGTTSQLPASLLPTHEAAATNRARDFPEFSAGDSPAPANPLQQLFAPLEQVTPDLSRRRVGGAHHQRAAPKDELSGIVSTPPASTIRRPARHQMVSPTADGDERIADRLASLWTEYVDKPTAATSSAAAHPLRVAEQHEVITTTTTTTSVEEAWSHHSGNLNYPHPTKRWMYRHVKTPEAASAHPQRIEAQRRGGSPPRSTLIPIHIVPTSNPSTYDARSASWATSSYPSGRAVEPRVTPPPTPHLGSSTSMFSETTSRQQGNPPHAASYHMPQSAAQTSYGAPHTYSAPSFGSHTYTASNAAGTDAAAQPSMPMPSFLHSATSSITSYPHTNAAPAQQPSLFPSNANVRGDVPAELHRYGLQSPQVGGGGYLNHHHQAHAQQPSTTTGPQYAPQQSATQPSGYTLGQYYDAVPTPVMAAQPTYSYGPVGLQMSSGVQESIRALEERERGQREHIRFVEAQARRNESTRFMLERPHGLAARPVTHTATPASAAELTTSHLWTAGAQVPNPSFHLPPSTAHIPNMLQYPSADDHRHVRADHVSSVVQRGGLDTFSHTSLYHRLSPPRSVSPHRRGPFLFERMGQIKNDELRARHDLEMAEYQVRDAVCSVIASLQQHAHNAAAQQALHRSLLITIADEQEGRKKLEALQEHIVVAIAHLYSEATQAMVTTAYERISFLTRLYSKMHSDESRQRLDMIDDEVLHRRALMVALHEAELSLYHSAASRLNEAHRALQRVSGHEAELRFGIVQEEDHIRNDKFARWAHERSVLDHLERQRLSSSRVIYSKLRNLQDQEHALRVDAEETQMRMHATLVAYSESAYERHRQMQQQSFERDWKEAQQREFAARIGELEEREQTLRREGVMAWECVVEALHEWKAEMALQQELESQFERKRRLVGRLQQVEDIETSSRTAIAFAEDAVHTQHASWAREMTTSIKEARASAMARLMHALGSNEAFTRSQIAEEWLRALGGLRQQEHAAYTQLLLHYCRHEEDENRETLTWLERQGVAVLRQHEATERQVHVDREFRAACRRHEHLAMVEAYHTAEADSRGGMAQTEASQRESLSIQCRREMLWIVEHIELRRKAAEEARRELTNKEQAAREERLATEAQEWFDLGRSEEVGHRRATEAANAAQRQREYQLRASSMTLCRLEEVNREVIVGAAAKSLQVLEERQSIIWKKFEEEHHRMMLVMEERKLRTFDEKRKKLFDDEALVRGELTDVAHDMWESLAEQFELRRPLAQSDNPQVVQFLHAEHRARIELEDLFTYERWNLTDLEAMSRDDVADGVAPLSLPRYDERSASRSHQPPNLPTNIEVEQQHHHVDVFSVAVGRNDFAQFIEDSFPQPQAAPLPPQPPHPTSWEYEDLSPPREYEPAVQRRVTSTSTSSAPPQIAAMSSAPAGLESMRLPSSQRPDIQQAMLHMRPSVSMGSSTQSTPTERTPAAAGPGSIPIPEALRALLRPAAASAPQLPPRSMPPPPRTMPSLRGVPPRQPPAAPSGVNMSRAVQDQLAADLLTQEAAGRKRVATTQYQQLAAIIQENIETLPEA